MKLKCVIIDDEPIARKVIQEYIEEIEFLELAGQAENPLKAMAILNAQDIDILLLDINMPKINGIDFLKSSRSTASVIITTAYAEYAVESYGLDVLDYLVKPIGFDRFLKACNKAREAAELKKLGKGQPQKPGDHFFVKSNNQIVCRTGSVSLHNPLPNRSRTGGSPFKTLSSSIFACHTPSPSELIV